jgi:hypothetical protein
MVQVSPTGLTYTSKVPQLSSASYHLRRGAGQVFCQPEHFVQVPAQLVPTTIPHERRYEGCPRIWIQVVDF